MDANMDERRAVMAALKAGDRVYVLREGYAPSVRLVERATKLHVMVGEWKFQRATGFLVRSRGEPRGFHEPTLLPITNETAGVFEEHARKHAERTVYRVLEITATTLRDQAAARRFTAPEALAIVDAIKPLLKATL